DDGVARGEAFVGHLDLAVAVEDGLKAVDGRGPGEVLDVAGGLGETPGDDDAVGELFEGAGPGHARVEEDADGGGSVDQRAGGEAEVVEGADGDAGRFLRSRRTEADIAGDADGEGLPFFSGEGEGEVVEFAFGGADFGAEVGVPAERLVVDAIAAVAGCEDEG